MTHDKVTGDRGSLTVDRREVTGDKVISSRVTHDKVTVDKVGGDGWQMEGDRWQRDG